LVEVLEEVDEDEVVDQVVAEINDHQMIEQSQPLTHH
jgi:hypothetical protein